MPYPQNILDFLTGGQPAEQPSAVQQILSARFEPDAQDVGNSALAGVAKGTYIDPQNYADARMEDAMKRLQLIDHMQQQKMQMQMNNQRLDLSNRQFDETMRHNRASEALMGQRIGVNGTKPLPPAALRMQQDSLDALGIANSIDADLGQVTATMDNGGLEIGPVENMISGARNYMGISSPNSRNFATFKATLEKLRNDSLRLNKGVQTEGDAGRAWNEILSNINDPALVRQRLAEVRQINQRAAQLHKNNISTLRGNYGYGDLDTSDYEMPAAILQTEQAPGKLIGTSGGKKVYELPNGQHVMEQ